MFFSDVYVWVDARINQSINQSIICEAPVGATPRDEDSGEGPNEYEVLRYNSKTGYNRRAVVFIYV